MRDSSFFCLHTTPGKEIPISYYFWGLKASDEFILVDTGFSSEAVKRRKADVTDFRSPQKLLKTVGIDPEKIEKVILTHLHWDHCESLDLFQNAVFFVQKRELEFVTGSYSRHPAIKEFIDVDPILELLRLNYEGRLVILDGDYQIGEGIRLIRMGGHTPGSQVVKVNTEKGDILISGDVIPLYRNMLEGVPPGIYSDLVEVLVAYERIGEMVKSLDAFMPGHDPIVADRFPFDGGIARIA